MKLHMQEDKLFQKQLMVLLKWQELLPTLLMVQWFVYGIAKAAEDGKVESFYNNDLTNYLNNVTAEMEDSFAHYKTERERTGDWWEPANVFSGNFYLIILLKNLGFCRCNGFRFCLGWCIKN
jgi:hypothetical protein